MDKHGSTIDKPYTSYNAKKVHQVFTKLSCTTCSLYKTSHFLPARVFGLGNTKVQFAPQAPGMSLLLRKLRY